ncbi:MAG: type VI secretion system protein TssA [Desulfobacterales bacterium]|nr:type VI secretion system protein TssA [Desulfobacterales bacterium]
MESFLNIETLLKPISPDRPSGEDLRYTELYDRIKEARRADDQLELGEWQTSIKTSDWRQVAILCEASLADRTKDLQMTVWLTEAWVKLHGYAGLAAGLDLTRCLLRDFWPTLYPPIEAGDLDYRIGPLTLLNTRLRDAVRQVPLCDTDRSKGYNYHQWEESRLVGFGQNLDKEQRKRREELIDEGKISAEDFAAAVNAGSPAYYQKLARQLDDCRRALQALDVVVTEKFAPNPPGFGQLLEAIEACGHIVGRVLKDKCKSEIVPQEASAPAAVSTIPVIFTQANEVDQEGGNGNGNGRIPEPPAIQAYAISDTSPCEKGIWLHAAGKAEKGFLKEAMDQLLSAAALSPSIREKNRYLLLLAKLCLKADRADLASPIAEELYKLIETLQLDKWEHPAWIADVVDTLFRCLAAADQTDSERAKTLFQKLCMLDVTKAAAYRLGA